MYPFFDSDGVHDLSDFFVESLSAELSGQENLDVVNRNALGQVEVLEFLEAGNYWLNLALDIPERAVRNAVDTGALSEFR